MLEISFQARVDDTDCRLGVLSVEFVRQFSPPTVAQDSDWILLDTFETQNCIPIAILPYALHLEPIRNVFPQHHRFLWMEVSAGS